MEILEKLDIQGFLLRGYGKLRHNRYALLHFASPEGARAWLGQVSLDITDGSRQTLHTSLNLAVTVDGLRALGLREESVRGFSREFREGMTELRRQRLLGDEGESSPVHWRWGGPGAGEAGRTQIHGLLMIFAHTKGVLENYWKQLEPLLASNDVRRLLTLDGGYRPGNKEAFGFRDGISQPVIAGNDGEAREEDLVAPGEFVLGYRNEYGVLPESPIIDAAPQQGDVSLLPTIAPGKKDLGRNGSYLVFRQIQQHVSRFWDFIGRNTSNEKERVWLASKMVGRWPSGAPLALYPDADPGGPNVENDFGYAKSDPEGHSCPIGSHVRRSNPRDAFEENPPAKSLRLTKKHRILRRGRSYEISVPQAAGEPARVEVGLHFICLNTDIAHQYEFVQHTWCNFPRFQHLTNDPDPIVGVPDGACSGVGGNFTIQGNPTNRHVRDLDAFVTIRGGAYFFLPSLNALRYFASL